MIDYRTLSDDEMLRMGLFELMTEAIGAFWRAGKEMTPELEHQLDALVEVWATRLMVRPHVAEEVRERDLSPAIGL